MKKDELRKGDRCTVCDGGYVYDADGSGDGVRCGVCLGSGTVGGSPKKIEELWEDFIVKIPASHMKGRSVPLCGLCGGRGIIDTRSSARAPWGDTPAGIRAFCICPNGQMLSRSQQGQELLKAGPD